MTIISWVVTYLLFKSVKVIKRNKLFVYLITLRPLVTSITLTVFFLDNLDKKMVQLGKDFKVSSGRTKM